MSYAKVRHRHITFDYWIILSPLISRNRIATIAITSKTWIKYPAEKTKKPSTHPIIRINAMRYNITGSIRLSNTRNRIPRLGFTNIMPELEIDVYSRFYPIAFFRSSIRSSASSTPTLKRIKESCNPFFILSSLGIEACVIEAG
jgi:hypothetical protein